MTETNYIGNISTIVKTICLWIAGYAIGYAVSIGFNLPISQEQLAEIFFIIICSIIAYIDAKNPNSFNWLGNGNLVDMGTILGYPSEEVVLNDEYELEGDEQDGC